MLKGRELNHHQKQEKKLRRTPLELANPS